MCFYSTEHCAMVQMTQFGPISFNLKTLLLNFFSAAHCQVPFHFLPLLNLSKRLSRLCTVGCATLNFTSVVILADSMGLIIFFHHNVSGESAELCFFCLPNITAMHCRQKYWDFSCFLIILFSSVYGTETESLIWCHYIYCKISKINLILFHVFWSVVYQSNTSLDL